MTTKYSKDELIAPEWLTKDFLERVLRHYKDVEVVKVNEFHISPGTSPGEHFASIMFKIDVKYESKGIPERLNFIMKTVPVEEGVKKEFLKDSTAFPTEIRMYEEILPKMKDILRQIGDSTVFAPDLVYQSNHPVPLIILKDMTPEGYITYAAPVQLESVRVITKKLAKFHACSMYLNENGTQIHSMTDTFYKPHPDKPDYAEEWLVPGLQLAIEEVRKWEGCERIVEKLKQCLPTFGERMTRVHLETTGQAYKVLNHGDFHFKNLLQRNRGLKDADVLMIDFQFCVYGTPAIDFIAMLYEIVSQDVRELHRNELVASYFETFVTTLKKLDHKGKIPELAEFEQELKRCGILEFGLLVCYGAFHYLDWEESDVMEAMENNDPFGPIKPVWQTNQHWKETFIRNVNEMINNGVLD